MQTITRKAYAKINLGLDVVRRLENGYHQVRMIMQTVDLYDELAFEKEESGIALLVDNSKNSVNGGAAGKVPADQSNLIWKAAKLLLDTAGVGEGVSIHLQKNIPVAAGMAGGSTDAAATLLGLNELFQLHYTVEELKDLGVKIGADVPYCVQGGTALAEGIGEVLSPLPAPPEATVLIAKPDIDVSTAFVYRNLRLEELERHPDIDGMVRALEAGSLGGIVSRLGNVLETVTIPAYPVIRQIKTLMLQEGALGALMSGSGPTVFGIFDQKEKAVRAAQAIESEKLSREVFVTGFEPRREAAGGC